MALPPPRPLPGPGDRADRDRRPDHRRPGGAVADGLAVARPPARGALGEAPRGGGVRRPLPPWERPGGRRRGSTRRGVPARRRRRLPVLFRSGRAGRAAPPAGAPARRPGGSPRRRRHRHRGGGPVGASAHPRRDSPPPGPRRALLPRLRQRPGGRGGRRHAARPACHGVSQPALSLLLPHGGASLLQRRCRPGSSGARAAGRVRRPRRPRGLHPHRRAGDDAHRLRGAGARFPPQRLLPGGPIVRPPEEGGARAG